MASQAKELMMRLAELMEATMEQTEHPFPDLALTPREVKVMIHLGDRGETTMTELADAVGTPLSTVTRIADRLERKGMIARSRSDRDRRIVVVSTSDQGQALHNAVREQQLAVSAKILEILTSEERETLVALLTKAAAGLRSGNG
ncbi:MarR family winged helix-turn-helix transcriptional regulator [Geomesophilobacter sediminis]|uniref:MarR family transcriptional regulator n=1 Tax=Geomesophilobacter sediminis TaxID=2798584 RepID=A0A8J7JG13_9BACT|nr:MarR family transcriptional regulator [Geomesophilobacter sediminis]MBJ6725454.1 MarR family transcriptional regulator [Geomesophilobacter sediminis]